MPKQLVTLDLRKSKELTSIFEERDLIATVHGSCDLTEGDADIITDIFGSRLYSIVADQPVEVDSEGRFVSMDAQKIGEFLSRISRWSRGTDLRFGIEDFPLNQEILNQHYQMLAEFFDCPRWGVLIDIGHMNTYFKGYSPEEYLSRVPLEIIELHVHDNNGEADSHSYLGDGNIDFDAVARGLMAIGFKGVSTLEIGAKRYGHTAEEAMPRVAESLAEWQKCLSEGRESAD